MDVIYVVITRIILACAMCAMAHTFRIQRKEMLTVRRDGARFSRIAHENFACAPFPRTCIIHLCKRKLKRSELNILYNYNPYSSLNFLYKSDL